MEGLKIRTALRVLETQAKFGLLTDDFIEKLVKDALDELDKLINKEKS